jgi:hypothetical protein
MYRSTFWHETESLRLDDEGVLYARVPAEADPETGEAEGTGLARLGAIDHAEDAAEELGLGDEYAECLDLWRDAGYDHAGQVRHDYRVLQGF